LRFPVNGLQLQDVPEVPNELTVWIEMHLWPSIAALYPQESFDD